MKILELRKSSGISKINFEQVMGIQIRICLEV
jgi:hypothetical protein